MAQKVFMYNKTKGEKPVGKVLLDKTINAHTSTQKKETWELFKKEFISSPIPKTIRLAKRKAKFRKDFAVNKLARHLTDGGKPPFDICAQLSSSKQELHAANALTIEGPAPNFDDDDKALMIVPSSMSICEAQPKNIKIAGDIIQLENSKVMSEDLLLLYGTKVEISSIENIETEISEAKKKRIKINPFNERFRKIPNDADPVVKAKTDFYLKKEKWAAERHELQMKMWQAERVEKKAEHEHFLEEHRLRIQLLTDQLLVLKKFQ